MASKYHQMLAEHTVGTYCFNYFSAMGSGHSEWQRRQLAGLCGQGKASHTQTY